MGRFLLALGALSVVMSCAPEYPYTRVLGPGRFDLRCHRGSADCEHMARQLCLGGYTVEGTRSGSIGSSQVIQCITPTHLGEAGALPVERPPIEEKEEAPEGEEEDVAMCADDRPCAGIRQLCVKGTCVLVPVGLTPEEAERCVIGSATSDEPVPLFPTEGALAEFLAAGPQTKAATLTSITRLNGTWVDMGVACRTIAQFVRGRRVQLTSGPLTGLQGWVAAEPHPPTPAPASSR